MTRAERVRYRRLGVSFVFCTYDCAREWAGGQDVEETSIEEFTLNVMWCVGCAECGNVFHRPVGCGSDWCNVHGTEPCESSRWLFTRTAAQFAMAWRRLAGVAQLGIPYPIDDEVWEQAQDMAFWMPDALGFDIAQQLWSKHHSSEGPFG